MKKRNVIIDCDPGVDDAVMLALAAAHREELEILGITTVSGNQDIKKVTANALNLAEFYGLSVPVARGMEKPVMRKRILRRKLMEKAGSGTVFFRVPEKHRSRKREYFLSAEFWENFLRESRQRSLPQAL